MAKEYFIIQEEEIADQDVPSESWGTQHQMKLQEAYRIAQERFRQAAQTLKNHLVKHAKETTMKTSDHVYMRFREVKARNMIQDIYRPDIYHVVQQREGHDVYRIQPVDEFEEVCWVNRAKLRLCYRLLFQKGEPYKLGNFLECCKGCLGHLHSLLDVLNEHQMKKMTDVDTWDMRHTELS